MKLSWKLPILGLIAAALAGCGGISGPIDTKTSTITGRVVDIDNNPIRGARVVAAGKETITTSTGSYQILNVRKGEVNVLVDYEDDLGNVYFGETWVLNVEFGQTYNATIIAAPSHWLGEVWGVVRDNNGALMENVPVFAYTDAGSSAKVFTDSNGEYSFDELVGGLDYEVSAMARGWRSDYAVVSVSAGESRRADMYLTDPSVVDLGPPTNLSAITWVSPTVDGRGGKRDIEWFKNLYEPERTAKKELTVDSRFLRSDLIAETDLLWDEIRHEDHLGWGVYRGLPHNTLHGLAFFDDPLSAWFFDAGVEPFSTYDYAVTTLSAWFPDYPQVTESEISNIVRARVLNRLNLRPMGLFTEFKWTSTSGAEDFIVFLFDRYPGPGVPWIWDSSHNLVTGFSTVYDGPSLTHGHEYYYIVLGLANNDNSRTLSEIGSFIH